MDDSQRLALKKNRVAIVDSLEPKGEVLDVLIEDGVLTDNDVEDVTSQTSQKARCHKLLALLQTRGPRAFDSLMKALKTIRCEHVIKKIESTLTSSIENSRATSSKVTEVCRKCKTFLLEIHNRTSHLNETLYAVLADNACVILHYVEPEDIVDQLIQDDVIGDDNDVIDEICGAATRRRRCERLFERLLEARDTQNAVSSLIEAFNKKYEYIAKQLSATHEQLLPRDTASLAITRVTTDGIQRDRKFEKIYNALSSFVNHGQYKKFQKWSRDVLVQFPENYDLLYAVEYIRARKDLFTADFDACKSHIKTGLELARKTQHPQYYELDILSAKSRMLIIQKKFGQAQVLIEDTLSVLMANPAGIPHKVSGWLNFNYARCITGQMACLNPTRENFYPSYFQLFRIARASFNRALDSFKRDSSNDGPFGLCYVLCRLAILMLHCGDNGHFIDEINASEDNIESAGQYLKQFEESGVKPVNMLKMQWNLARSDYQLRLENYDRALDYAYKAMRVILKMDLLEFKDHVQHRLEYLEGKVPMLTDEVMLQMSLKLDYP